MNDTIKPADIKRSRRTLVLLLLTFIMPIVIAYVAFIYLNSDGVGKTKNYGSLLSQARPLTTISLKQLNGQAYTQDDLRNAWTLVYFDTADCGEVCEHALFRTRQARLSQNEEVKRVKRLFVITEGNMTPRLEKILTQHPDLSVAQGDRQQIDSMLKQFTVDAELPAAKAQKVYLVDPLGNLMMSYPKGFTTRGLIRDLQHLLKWSKIG